MSKRMNITKRGSVWYFTMRYKGKRYATSLNTGDRTTALERAKLARERIWGARWHEIAGDAAAVPASAIGLLVSSFFAFSAGRLEPRTAMDYVSCLRLVTRRGLNHDEWADAEVDRQSAAVLDGKLVRGWETWMLGRAAATNDAAKLASAKRSTISVLRQARGMFKPACLEWYAEQGIVVPAAGILQFLKAPVSAPPRLQRRAPSEEEVRPLFEAAAGLKAIDRPAFTVWLLATWTGLRRGELADLEWAWLTTMNGHGVLALPEGFQKNGSAETIPLHPRLFAELRDYQATRAGERYVFPSAPAERLRCEDLFRAVYAWMKHNGWPECHKLLHGMRAYFGGLARQQHGEEWAKALMRHSEGSTLRRNYIGAPELTGRWIELPAAELLPLAA